MSSRPRQFQIQRWILFQPNTSGNPTDVGLPDWQKHAESTEIGVKTRFRREHYVYFTKTPKYTSIFYRVSFWHERWKKIVAMFLKLFHGVVLKISFPLVFFCPRDERGGFFCRFFRIPLNFRVAHSKFINEIHQLVTFFCFISNFSTTVQLVCFLVTSF